MARKRRSLLGKKPCSKGKIRITELSLVLRFILLEQNDLLKKQKCNLKSGLKEKIAIKKQVNKLLCGIKLLLKSNFCSLSDKSQVSEVLLESAFRCLLILLLLLQFLFGSGPG
jgi:hypothetical protein